MFVGAGATDGHSAIASDGRFLYIHNGAGLHKVGSGYGGTVKVCCWANWVIEALLYLVNTMALSR